MTGDTQVWIAVRGSTNEHDEPLTRVELAAMLGAAPAIDRDQLAQALTIELYRARLLPSIDATTEVAVRAAVDAAFPAP